MFGGQADAGGGVEGGRGREVVGEGAEGLGCGRWWGQRLGCVLHTLTHLGRWGGQVGGKGLGCVLGILTLTPTLSFGCFMCGAHTLCTCRDMLGTNSTGLGHNNPRQKIQYHLR